MKDREGGEGINREIERKKGRWTESLKRDRIKVREGVKREIEQRER